jgi:hypothetical protein
LATYIEVIRQVGERDSPSGAEGIERNFKQSRRLAAKHPQNVASGQEHSGCLDAGPRLAVHGKGRGIDFIHGSRAWGQDEYSR